MVEKKKKRKGKNKKSVRGLVGSVFRSCSGDREHGNPAAAWAGPGRAVRRCHHHHGPGRAGPGAAMRSRDPVWGPAAAPP